MQARRECWVVLLQSSVSIHDLDSPVQKDRIPTYDPVHVELWKKSFVINSPETEQGKWSKIFHNILQAKLCSCQALNCPLFSVKTARWWWTLENLVSKPASEVGGFGRKKVFFSKTPGWWVQCKKWPKSCFQSDIVSRVLEKKLGVHRVLEEKTLKFGRVWDFTGVFGLKVCEVSAGFGCREGYYPWKALISAANVMEISWKKYDWTAPWEILMKRWLLRHGQMGGGRWPNRRRRVMRL